MNRRLFLGMLVGAVLDPERLLWRPGAKLISIPKPRVLTVEQVTTEMLKVLCNRMAVAKTFDREYAREFEQDYQFVGGTQWVGNTITVRRPARFTR